MAGTCPSHALADYRGSFEHPLYPPLRIVADAAGQGLALAFRAAVLPLSHVHFDRFDTADDEVHGKWSVNFSTDPQGQITALVLKTPSGEFTLKKIAGVAAG